jgi:hypothetical protein
VAVGLQKSDHEEKYYINFGVWVKRLGAATFPKEHQCRIQSRLTSLFTDDQMRIDEA